MIQRFALISMLITTCYAYTPELTLYKGANNNGDSFTTRSKHADFIKQAPEVISATTSYCLRGWLGFYTEIDYNGRRGITLSGHPNLHCVNNTALNASFLKSVRYLGPENTEDPTISFYSEEHNVGVEIVLDEIEYPIILEEFRPMSLVTTGWSNWTLYNDVNFNGNATCYVSTTEYHELWRLDSAVSDTKSIKFGCNGKINKYFYAN